MSVCVGERERERERESVCVCCECMCVCVCVCLLVPFQCVWNMLVYGKYKRTGAQNEIFIDVSVSVSKQPTPRRRWLSLPCAKADCCWSVDFSFASRVINQSTSETWSGACTGSVNWVQFLAAHIYTLTSVRFFQLRRVVGRGNRRQQKSLADRGPRWRTRRDRIFVGLMAIAVTNGMITSSCRWLADCIFLLSVILSLSVRNKTRERERSTLWVP